MKGETMTDAVLKKLRVQTKKVKNIQVPVVSERERGSLTELRIRLGRKSVPLDALLGEKANCLIVNVDDVEQAKERLVNNIERGTLNTAIELVKYCQHQEEIIREKRKGLLK
jgi:hypothetical protein